MAITRVVIPKYYHPFLLLVEKPIPSAVGCWWRRAISACVGVYRDI